GLAVFFLLSAMMLAAPEQKRVLSGQALDPDDHALPKVRIKIIRGSEPVIESKTGDDGTYSISFPQGKPVDVQYDLTDWDTAVIRGLSGARDHSINKTLYPSGTPTGSLDPVKADPKHFKLEFE